MKFKLLCLKRAIEDILMLPFIATGTVIALLKPLKRQYRIFFFFPFYHTGGAEKIHALIATATGGKDCIIFFTRRSTDNTFLEKFKSSGCVIKDISKYTDNKWLYLLNIIYRGIVSGYINQQRKSPVVFNGQCNFGYKISPWILGRIKQIELIHSFNTFSFIRIPFLPFIDKTVMISKKRIEEHLQLYKQYGIHESYAERIVYVPNISEFDAISIEQKDFSTSKVLYSGRGTSEKRVHLFVAIARKVHETDPSIQFQIVGDVSQAVEKDDFPFIDFTGNISDPEKMKEAYLSSNILLITSSTEGFPLAVIEAMAYGSVIIATPVGDIPEHVKPNEKGFLFSTVDDEQKIIDEGVSFILQLKKNPELLKKIAASNIVYAQENFSYTRFAEAYKKVIEN